MDNKAVVDRAVEFIESEFSDCTVLETQIDGFNGSFLVKFALSGAQCYFFADKSHLQLSLTRGGQDYDLQEKYPDLQGKWQNEESVELFLTTLKKDLSS